MEIILASASPRRQELLKSMGYKFTVDVSDVDEQTDLPPKQAVIELALRKAKSVAERHSDGIIIASDTLVALDNKPLGKPADIDDAKHMLRALSGRTHEVYTGVCVIDAACEKKMADVDTSSVTFRELSDEEIDSYISTGEPMDKAGAYAIQGDAGVFVSNLEGSFENVMGFPVELVGRMLAGFGL